jgi:hypothetical protein
VSFVVNLGDQRLRGLFWTLQDSVVAVFDAAGTAFRSLGDGFASM